MENRKVVTWWKRAVVYTCISISVGLGTVSCAALDLLKPNNGISVEAQVGKENEKTVGFKSEDSVNSFAYDYDNFNIAPENIEEGGRVGGIVADNYTIETPITIPIILLMLLLWALPTPKTMWDKTKEFLRKVFKRGKKD